MNTEINYLNGFGNHFESEAIPNALIKNRNSPQKVPYGLYAEQLSGSAFCSPRHTNLRSWLYRLQPSVVHGEFSRVAATKLSGPPSTTEFTPPTQMRWDPLPIPETPCDFIQSLITFAGNGSIDLQTGAAIHLYCATASMQDNYFYNADGEFLIVPQEGKLNFLTEFGRIEVESGEIIVIPRGIKFQVQLVDKFARGYICENFGAPFRLPDLGLIGANGLANSRDFQIPQASFEEKQQALTLLCKFQGHLWQADINHSPLNVVAWHGNYVPDKYNLKHFNTFNTVSYDHPDPSIFTVLTSPATNTIPNVDFVIFPPRWMVADETFRPPYFHRNIMSEYMGLIYGSYDAKKTGFIPGSSSLHNCMSAHGPDAAAYNQALNTSLVPEYYDNTLAFMFESKHVWRLTETAYYLPSKQKNYLNCWKDLTCNFMA